MSKFPGSNIEVVRRYNRPSPSRKAYLELFVLENGAYTDVYQVCSVHVFPKISYTASGYDAHYFQDGTTRLVATSSTSAIAFVFSGLYGTEGSAAGISLGTSAVSGYLDDASGASSIWQVGTGHYGVVLTPSALYRHPESASGDVYNNASSIGGYFDVWTIVTTSGQPASLYIEEFDLAESTFFHLTEPIQVKANNKLKTPRIRLGAKENILVNTAISILNTNISSEVISSLGRSIIDSAKLRIVRYNNQGDYPNFVEVLGFDDTSGGVHVDSDDTISYLFDTNLLKVVPNLDSRKGVYHVQVNFNLFDQVLYSDEFPLIIE